MALSYGSRCHLDALGVWGDIKDSDVGRIEHIDVFEVGNSGAVTMDADDKVDALGYVLEITQILKPMHKKIADSNIQWFCPAKLDAFTSYAEHVEITLSTGNQMKTIHSRLLVGADGTNSFVRRLAGITTRGWDQNRFGLVASVQSERNHQNVAYECFREQGPLAFLPLADGRSSIVWAVPPQEAMHLLAMPELAFLKKLERATSDDALAKLGQLQAIGKRAVYPLELRVASCYAKQRVALIGNAAHTMHPVAGQGMNLGFRDVLVLAEVLNHELHGEQVKQDPGAAILMQAYAEKRRADVLAVAGFTEVMLESFTHTLLPSKWLRARALESMQMLPMLKSELLQHAAGMAQMQHLQLPQINMSKQGEQHV